MMEEGVPLHLGSEVYPALPRLPAKFRTQMERGVCWLGLRQHICPDNAGELEAAESNVGKLPHINSADVKILSPTPKAPTKPPPHDGYAQAVLMDSVSFQ